MKLETRSKGEKLMPKVKNNIFLNGLIGMLGKQFVIKRMKGGATIVTNRPTFSQYRKFSEKQKAHQQKFQEATAYGKVMKRHPVYLALAEGTPKTGYNIAVADWWHPPEILEVDLGGWRDGSGGAIRVKAQDDVRVVSVSVTIETASGKCLEMGEAQESGALWWEYHPAQPPAEGLQVTVIARDMPRRAAVWKSE
jgi:hypothetical protein